MRLNWTRRLDLGTCPFFLTLKLNVTSKKKKKREIDKVMFGTQPILCWGVASTGTSNLEMFSPGGDVFMPMSHGLEDGTEDRAGLENKPEGHASHCWVPVTWPDPRRCTF